jgi:hypothetical protein
MICVAMQLVCILGRDNAISLIYYANCANGDALQP